MVLGNRSTSPVVIDDEVEGADDEGKAPEAEPQTGVLGILLDLYKFQVQGVLDPALRKEILPVRRGRSSGSRKASPAHEPSIQQATTSRDTVGSYSTLAGDTGATDSAASTSSSVPDSTTGLDGKEKRQRQNAQLKGRPHWPHDEHTVARVSQAIRVHISRQLYLIKLCRALMTYGAPTHRLES